MERKLTPIKIKAINADQAWFYVNKRSIDVCIFQKKAMSGTLTARITENQLRKLLTTTN